jgi:hypothetical protein
MLPPKKAAPHDHDRHHQANDLRRRTCEPKGRIEVLRKSLKSSIAEAFAELTMLAQREIEGGKNKDAADFLRASEHLSFAVIAGETLTGGRISSEHERSITEHFDECTRKADEHW